MPLQHVLEPAGQRDGEGAAQGKEDPMLHVSEPKSISKREWFDLYLIMNLNFDGTDCNLLCYNILFPKFKQYIPCLVEFYKLAAPLFIYSIF